ncbi:MULTISPECIES: hypothetical protein [unclassified Nonomuraea]|uniref:hypothetical protein n=1 Tax=unclassified Nonomuraea TaxID=2593643 RepID=UPI0033EEFB71
MTTVYFGSLTGGQATAAARSLATAAATALVYCALVRLLPRNAAARRHRQPGCGGSAQAEVRTGHG